MEETHNELVDKLVEELAKERPVRSVYSYRRSNSLSYAVDDFKAAIEDVFRTGMRVLFEMMLERRKRR